RSPARTASPTRSESTRRRPGTLPGRSWGSWSFCVGPGPAPGSWSTSSRAICRPAPQRTKQCGRSSTSPSSRSRRSWTPPSSAAERSWRILMLRDAIRLMGESRLLRRIATEAPFASGVARRFVAGETLDDAVKAARALNEAGMHVSLDYLGESVSNREEAVAAADVYLQLLDRIATERLDANASLKLTQMGQDINEAFLRENVGRVLDSAREKQIFIRFDMESSAYTQRTLDFFRGVWEEGYRNVGVVIQS